MPSEELAEFSEVRKVKFSHIPEPDEICLPPEDSDYLMIFDPVFLKDPKS